MSAVEPGGWCLVVAGLFFIRHRAVLFCSPALLLLAPLVVVDAILRGIGIFRCVDATVIEHMFLGLLARDIMLSLFWAHLQDGLLAGGQQRLGVIVL